MPASSAVEAPITLTRPIRRRRRLLLILGIGLPLILVAGAFGAKVWMDAPGVMSPIVPIPSEQGSEAMEPLIEAQDEYFAAHDSFAPSIVELEMTDGMAFQAQANTMYRVIANQDGSAYVAGAVGFTGEYAAVAYDGSKVLGVGSGPSFLDALQDSGWTAKWGSEQGFNPVLAVDRNFGGIGVTATTSLMVRMNPDTSTYQATVTPVPATGSGATLADAVRDAGSDPAMFPDATTESAKASAADGSATLTVAREGELFEVRIEYAPTATVEGVNIETVLAEAGIEPQQISSPNGRFQCATSASANGIHSATLCSAVTGEVAAFASTGSASSAIPAEFALGEIGATPAWAERHGFTLPTWDDLF